ncbi:hypothetical protein L0Y65_06530, partial [Candidatus Micrarchaeota archaeon]|nr:hypothetical protein [Candidatus Micrarchaeota archaeon]
MFHEHDKTLIAMVLVLLVAAAFYVFAAAPTKPVNEPKLSQASLDLDTSGCPTYFGEPYCQKQTEWSLDKTTAISAYENPENKAYLFDVKVVEGETSKKLMGSGKIVLTNSGQLSAVLSSIAVNLEKSTPQAGDAPGPSGENWKVLASAVQTESASCGGTAVSCYGNITEKGGELFLYDTTNNDLISLTGIYPIPATTDNDGDGKRDEDPPYGIDNDND